MWSVASSFPNPDDVSIRSDLTEGLAGDIRQVFGVFIERGIKVHSLQANSSMKCVYNMSADGNG